jgi:hypothetical protein
LQAAGGAGGYAFFRGGRGFGAQGRPRSSPDISRLSKSKQLFAESETLAVDSEDAPAAPATPADKIAEPLRDLAKLVEEKGTDGNLTVGDLIVAGHKVDVMVFLSDLSEATLKALKDLGFEQSAESKATKLLIGTIDVRKLPDLAKLDAVVRVSSVPGAGKDGDEAEG